MDGHPVIESVAADTTSTYTQQQQQQQQAFLPHSSPDHQFSDMPPAKRCRTDSECQLDETAGFMFPHVDKTRQRASGPSSILHPSGRMLPVGIAQPMQSRDHEQREPLSDWDYKTDTKPTWEGEGEGDKTNPLQTTVHHQSTSSSVDVDEEVTVQKVMSQMESDSSISSDSDSDSDSSSDDGRTEVGQQHVKQQYGNVTVDTAQSIKDPQKHASAQMMRKSSSASLGPVPVSEVGIPAGKKHHVFLSHSTGDQQAVKGNIVVPLRESYSMQTVACYHCMHGKQYNDRHIDRAMQESCVIVVAISPSYLESPRCQREWNRAVGLVGSGSASGGGGGGGGGGCEVVVAAVGKCSRPDRLKSFLYLDFIDPSKRAIVLEKLFHTIGVTVNSLSSIPEATGSEGDSQPETSRQEEEEEKQAGSATTAPVREDELESSSNNNANERDLLSLAAVGGYAGLDMSEMHHRRMEAEFEAEFGAEFGAEFRGGWGGSGSEGVLLEVDQASNSSDPRMNDLATSREGEGSGQSPDSRSDGVGGAKEQTEDVEEGEVSDSSSGEKANSSEPVQKQEGGRYYNEQAQLEAAKRNESQRVAKFYNELAQPDADRRDESPIFYMRNFNNWVKSILLRTYLHPHSTVLDLCCGKGGDLLKWKEGGIDYVVCADISESSVEACQCRYRSHRMSERGTGEPPFQAEFHVADCCEKRLRTVYRNAGCRFHLVSCQFSVHYAFESYDRAHMMLRNACENLRPGSFFIGTTVDSNEIVRRLRDANQKNEDGSWFIGNEVFTVTLDHSLDPWEQLPVFGARYNFKLHGVVDLPEFLVHFPLFVKMLEDFDMELVQHQNFTNFFSEQRYKPQNANLMYKMQAFSRQTATMPQALWEVIGLYLVYVFRKRDPRDL